MNRFTAVVLLVLTLSSVVLAGDFMDNWRGQQILEAQQLLFNDHFSAVDSIFREHIVDHPEDPAGYLFRAGAMFARMTDREENLQEDLFKQSLDTVEILTSRIIDTCDARTAAWMYLLRGHARAYRSLYESKFGSFLSALKLGLGTIDEYEAGLKRDSSLIDLYFGIGSYHYWKSAKAGLLRWIRIFKDEKDKGIEELRMAADSSLLHRDLARSALVWIWLDQKQYDSVVNLAEVLYERYPEGKTFLWPMAYAYYRQNNFAAAAEVFARIRAKLEADPGNYFNLVECDFHLVQSYTWMGDDERAVAVARHAEAYREHIPPYILKRQHARLNYLKRVARRN